MSDYSSEEEYKSEGDLIRELTVDDFLKHPETETILEDDFFDRVKDDMSDHIEAFYKSEVEYANESLMNIFNKDMDSKMSYDFFLTIY